MIRNGLADSARMLGIECHKISILMRRLLTRFTSRLENDEH